MDNVKSQTNYAYPIAADKTLASAALAPGGKYAILAISLL